MALFHLQKMFSFRYCFKKDWSVYWFYILYPGNIIIKYGQVRFRVKSANSYESYGLFFNFFFFFFFFFAKYLRVDEDGSGRGHLCHTDTFLVFFYTIWRSMCHNVLHSGIYYNSASNRYTFIDSFLPSKSKQTLYKKHWVLWGQAESNTESFQGNFLHYSCHA